MNFSRTQVPGKGALVGCRKLRSYWPWFSLALALHAAYLTLLASVTWRLPPRTTSLPLRIAITGVLGAGTHGQEGDGRTGDERVASSGVSDQLAQTANLDEGKQSKVAVPSRFSGAPERKEPARQGRPAVSRGARRKRSDVLDVPQTQGRSHAEGKDEAGNSIGGGNPAASGAALVGTEHDGASAGSGNGSGTVGTGGYKGLGDARALCLYCPAPTYPAIARQRSWSGVVRVWLELADDGTVRTVLLESSSGYEVLDREALAAARRSRFRLPPEWSGTAAAGIIEYRFELVP